MTTNFKSNIKARLPELLDTLDVETLYNTVKQRVSKTDELFNLLSEDSQIIMLNNILIFNLTDAIIEEFKDNGQDTIKLFDSVLGSVIATEEFRKNNMYPDKGEDTLTFLDRYKPQGLDDEGTIR